MAQYKLTHIDMKGNRGELHDLLNLTGAEVSCNTLPAGASVPFVHHHTQNEEVYLILEGKGMLYIDGEEVPLKEGDCFRIDPQGERCLRAADDSAMRFICIQAKAGSLEGFTMSDAGSIRSRGSITASTRSSLSRRIWISTAEGILPPCWCSISIISSASTIAMATCAATPC